MQLKVAVAVLAGYGLLWCQPPGAAIITNPGDAKWTHEARDPAGSESVFLREDMMVVGGVEAVEVERIGGEVVRGRRWPGSRPRPPPRCGSPSSCSDRCRASRCRASPPCSLCPDRCVRPYAPERPPRRAPPCRCRRRPRTRAATGCPSAVDVVVTRPHLLDGPEGKSSHTLAVVVDAADQVRPVQDRAARRVDDRVVERRGEAGVVHAPGQPAGEHDEPGPAAAGEPGVAARAAGAAVTTRGARRRRRRRARPASPRPARAPGQRRRRASSVPPKAASTPPSAPRSTRSSSSAAGIPPNERRQRSCSTPPPVTRSGAPSASTRAAAQPERARVGTGEADARGTRAAGRARR